MQREIVEPVETEESNGDRKYEHPAFAQISANRVSGGAILYGSDFEHQHFMTIRIRKSQLNRSLSRDWHFGREDVVEVALSEAQWATFVSSPNMGSGVPCTLKYLQGKRMPDLPLRREIDESATDIRRRSEEMANRVKAAIAAVTENLAGVSERKKSAILAHLVSLQQELHSSLPYFVTMFDEHLENSVERAKADVHAYAQVTLQRAGLDALQEVGAKQLSAGESHES